MRDEGRVVADESNVSINCQHVDLLRMYRMCSGLRGNPSLSLYTVWTILYPDAGNMSLV